MGEPDRDYFDDEDFLDPDESEFEEAMENCSGWFEEGSGRFVCGAVWSEDCDGCPCYDWLGLTSDEVDELEEPT